MESFPHTLLALGNNMNVLADNIQPICEQPGMVVNRDCDAPPSSTPPTLAHLATGDNIDVTVRIDQDTR